MNFVALPDLIDERPANRCLSDENISLDCVLGLTNQLAEEIIYAKLCGQVVSDRKISTLVVVSLQLRKFGIQWPAAVNFALDAPLQLTSKDEHRNVSLGAMCGRVDEVNTTLVRGWALNEGDPREPVNLEIVVNGVVIAVISAALHRPDLAEKKIGTGFHGFLYEFSDAVMALPVKNIAVRRRFDRKILEQ